VSTRPPADAFLGAPIETDLARIDADVAVIGLPHGSAYPSPGPTVGCADAPAAIRRRSARLARFRGHWDFDLDGPLLDPLARPRLVDVGDVPGSPAGGAANHAAGEAAVRAILDLGAMPIALGGDDSVPIPFLRAFAGRGPFTVVQVDAHLDFRDEVDGVRDGYSSPMRRASEMGHVARIVQVGLRGTGSARAEDVDDARGAGNVLLTARALRERGVASVLAAVPDGPLLLSFDADGLDPSVCGAVSAPAPGGLSYDDAFALVRGLRPRLAGAVFTELVPDRDPLGTGTLALLRLVIAAIVAPG
jgi:agmatinase